MTWIFLRGLTREARHWGTFADHFAALVSPSRVYAQDLPGNGAFYLHDSPTTVSAMVEFARNQLQAKGIRPPYRLLAMSLGGMVAADWAQRYPGDVEGLVLINTSMRPASVAQRLRPANWLRLGLLAARWSDANATENTIHQLTCNNTAQRAQDLVRWQHIRKTAPVSNLNALRQLLAAARFGGTGAAPRCPVLVLASRADRLVNPVCSTQLAQRWKADYRTHPWAGHDLPHDDSAWVCTQASDWMAAQLTL